MRWAPRVLSGCPLWRGGPRAQAVNLSRHWLMSTPSLMSYEPLTSTKQDKSHLQQLVPQDMGQIVRRWLIVHASDVPAYSKARCFGLHWMDAVYRMR